jgi:hypothetical protein
MRANEFVTEAEDFTAWLDRQVKMMKDKSGYDGYRGVGQQEFNEIIKTKHPLPSTDLMPFDNEIIEYGMGEGEFTQEEIEQWVRDTVPWYDGSLVSVKGGVNFTKDLSNAEGYGNYVLALKTKGPVADFSDIHSFAKNYKDVDVVAYKKPGSKNWIKL